jgi:hypothetical protein
MSQNQEQPTNRPMKQWVYENSSCMVRFIIDGYDEMLRLGKNNSKRERQTKQHYKVADHRYCKGERQMLMAIIIEMIMSRCIAQWGGMDACCHLGCPLWSCQ